MGEDTTRGIGRLSGGDMTPADAQGEAHAGDGLGGDEVYPDAPAPPEPQQGMATRAAKEDESDDAPDSAAHTPDASGGRTTPGYVP